MLVAFAYLLGTQAAGLAEDCQVGHNVEEYRSKAAKLTATILRRMGTIRVGDTLSNFAFEDIDGELHLLDEIITDRTLITYMKPDCDGCLVELERLRSAAQSQLSRSAFRRARHPEPVEGQRPEKPDSDIYDHVLIISSANPLHMQRLREDYGLGCLMLYDEERYFGSALKIMSYPFNLVVNKDRVILEIHGNVMLEDDYERLFSLGLNNGRSGCSQPDRRPMWTSAGHGRPVQAQPGHPEPVEAYTHPVIPAQAGTQTQWDEVCTLPPGLALIPKQLGPGIRQGDRSRLPSVIPALRFVIPAQAGIHDRYASQELQASILGRLTDSRSFLKNDLPSRTRSKWTWAPDYSGVTDGRIRHPEPVEGWSGAWRTSPSATSVGARGRTPTTNHVT